MRKTEAKTVAIELIRSANDLHRAIEFDDFAVALVYLSQVEVGLRLLKAYGNSQPPSKEKNHGKID